MAILILNHRVPLHLVPYHQLLADAGEPLHLFLGEMRPEYQAEGFFKSYASVQLFEDFATNGALEEEALALHARTPIKAIVTASEFSLLRAARLRDRLGVAGQSAASALAYRNKLVMKAHVRRANLPVPRHRGISSPIDVIDFVRETGFPVVIKPILGAQSVNTVVVRNERELRDRLSAGFAVDSDATTDMEIEEFVHGTMYHVDGVVHQGELVACWPSCYVELPPLVAVYGVSMARSFGSRMLGAENPLVPRLREFARKVVAALPSPQNMVFHLEVFHTPGDDIVFCEVASRTGGPRISDVFSAAWDVDLIECMIRSQANLALRAPSQLGRAPGGLFGDLLIPATEGTLGYLPDQCPLEGVVDYHRAGQPGTAYKSARTYLDYVASFVLHAPAEDQLEQRIRAAADWFTREARWE